MYTLDELEKNESELSKAKRGLNLASKKMLRKVGSRGYRA